MLKNKLLDIYSCIYIYIKCILKFGALLLTGEIRYIRTVKMYKLTYKFLINTYNVNCYLKLIIS